MSRRIYVPEPIFHVQRNLKEEVGHGRRIYLLNARWWLRHPFVCPATWGLSISAGSRPVIGRRSKDNVSRPRTRRPESFHRQSTYGSVEWGESIKVWVEGSKGVQDVCAVGMFVRICKKLGRKR